MTIAEYEITRSKSPIASLDIKGYRAFKDLSLSGLSRVNLITGKNNVGKSSLLEAIHLYARRGSPEAMWQLLTSRETELSRATPQSLPAIYDAIIRMFNGASPFTDWASDHELSLMASVAGSPVGQRAGTTLSIDLVRPQPATDIPVGMHTILKDRSGGYLGYELTYALRRIVESDRYIWVKDGALPSVFVGARGLIRVSLGELWDSIALSPRKDDVIRGLWIINTEIEDLALFGESASELGRVPNVRVKGEFARRSLSEFGDGLNRLFDILVAIVNASEGFLLVDEIENGLHYSVLPSVWKLVFELAQRLNVQVFATTHSWECIEAFQSAATESPSDGALIRLQNKNGDIAATVFDEEDLQVITRDQIEVR